jgi:hypothetical protein
MACRILELPEGSASLEFLEVDVSLVKQEIERRWGEPRLEQHATFVKVMFGVETFLHTNEWDAPCLISNTTAGAKLLRELVGDIGALPYQ